MDGLKFIHDVTDTDPIHASFFFITEEICAKTLRPVDINKKCPLLLYPLTETNQKKVKK